MDVLRMGIFLIYIVGHSTENKVVTAQMENITSEILTPAMRKDKLLSSCPENNLTGTWKDKSGGGKKCEVKRKKKRNTTRKEGTVGKPKARRNIAELKDNNNLQLINLYHKLPIVVQIDPNKEYQCRLHTLLSSSRPVNCDAIAEELDKYFLRKNNRCYFVYDVSFYETWASFCDTKFEKAHYSPDCKKVTWINVKNMAITFDEAAINSYCLEYMEENVHKPYILELDTATGIENMCFVKYLTPLINSGTRHAQMLRCSKLLANVTGRQKKIPRNSFCLVVLVNNAGVTRAKKFSCRKGKLLDFGKTQKDQWNKYNALRRYMQQSGLFA